MLCRNAFQTATKLENLTIIDIEGELKTRNEHFGEKAPKFSKQLKTFGEAGIVKIGKDGKIGKYGAPSMFVGYTCNQIGDFYCM